MGRLKKTPLTLKKNFRLILIWWKYIRKIIGMHVFLCVLACIVCVYFLHVRNSQAKCGYNKTIRLGFDGLDNWCRKSMCSMKKMNLVEGFNFSSKLELRFMSISLWFFLQGKYEARLALSMDAYHVKIQNAFIRKRGIEFDSLIVDFSCYLYTFCMCIVTWTEFP